MKKITFTTQLGLKYVARGGETSRLSVGYLFTSPLLPGWEFVVARSTKSDGRGGFAPIKTWSVFDRETGWSFLKVNDSRAEAVRWFHMYLSEPEPEKRVRALLQGRAEKRAAYLLGV